MNARPIINIRHQLRWHQRLYSDASTLALWSAWLWLCRPAILGAIGMVGVAFGLERPAQHAVAGPALPSIEAMVLLLAGVSVLLLLWKRLSREPAVRPRTDRLPDFGRHFGLGIDQISAARDSRRCVVHHDEQGRIVAIESAAPALPAQAAVNDPEFTAAA